MRSFLHRLSLQSKLLLTMILAGFPVLMAAGYYLTIKSQDDYRSAERVALETAQAIGYQHLAQVEGMRNLLVTLAEYPQVRSEDGKACSRLFRSILSQSPSCLNIGLADLDGNLIASGVPGSFNISDRKYFRDALRFKRFSVGEYTISRAVGKPALHFALPVLDADGEPRAVIYSTFDLSQFHAMFDSQHLPPNSVLNVTDHKGVVVYRYPSHPVVKPGLVDRPDLRRFVTGPKAQGTFVHVGLDGVKRLLAFTRMRLHPDADPYLYIRVSIPEETALAGAYRLIIFSVSVFLAAVFAAFVLSRVLVGRFVTNPIRQLIAATDSITRGDLAARTGLSHLGSEIGLLAGSFDAMAEALAARRAERDRAEASLKASQEKLHAIFDHMSEALLIHDCDTGGIIDVNQAMCDMFECTYEEACGSRPEGLSDEETSCTPEEMYSRMREAAAGIPQLFTWRCRSRRGRVFWAEISMRRAAIGNVDRLIVLVRDVSERVAAEQERRSLTDQLHQSQKIESVGRLAGGIAHDFNNLLTPIIGFAELSKKEATSDHQLRFRLDGILKAASRAKDLTRQLLSFGRKQQLVMIRIDLNDTVMSFSDILRRTIRENIEIKLELADLLPKVRADRTQVEQVLMNLVVNAQDSIADEGSITIVTSVTALDVVSGMHDPEVRPVPHVLLSVTDSGCGIEEGVVQQIFDPFFTTKEVGEGSGLGLATVYGIMKQHEGHVSVHSELGKGSTFSLYFPAVSDEPQEVPAVPADFPVVGAHPGAAVLLVEDNPMVRELVRELLRSCGYMVIEAMDPTEALAVAQGRHIDLLLTDVIMPGMNGPQLYKLLAETHAEMKVLFMSGYTGNLIEQHLEPDATFNFIQKPFTMSAMAEKLSVILARQEDSCGCS